MRGAERRSREGRSGEERRGEEQSRAERSGEERGGVGEVLVQSLFFPLPVRLVLCVLVQLV